MKKVNLKIFQLGILKIKIFILFLVIFLNIQAQNNPGYVGRKNVFSLSATVFPYAWVNYGGLTPALGFSYERSLFRNMSVELSYCGYTLAENERFLNIKEFEFGGNETYVYNNKSDNTIYQGRVTGTGKTVHQNIGISLKNYIQRRGGIAPIGSFVGIKIQQCSWTHKSPNYSSYYIDENGDKIFLMSNGQPTAQSALTLGLFIGRKTLILKGLTLGWSLGTGIVISSTIPKPYYVSDVNEYTNRNDFINAVVKRNVNARNLMELKFELGYNL